MEGENTAVRFLPGGSVLQVGAGGTIDAASAGSVSLPAAVSFAGTVIIGGTAGRWAFGTVGLTSGVGTIATGFSRVISASVQPVSPDPPGLGSFTTAVIDLSLSASGSVIIRAGAGTLPYTNNGTAAWMALGI